MTNNVVGLLDRQGEFLRSQVGANFLASVEPYLHVLQSEPAIAAHLEALRTEAYELGSKHRDVEAEPSTIAYDIECDVIAQVDPRVDEGDVLGWKSLEKLFGDVHHPTIVPLNVGSTRDYGRAGRIIASVASHLDAVGWESCASAPANVRREFAEAQAEHHQNHSALMLVARASPGIALLRLEKTVAVLRGLPEPSLDRPPLIIRAEEEELINEAVLGRITVAAEPALDQLVTELKSASERLELELRRRVGTVLSRLAIIERFRARAEWHDRERLLRVAQGSPRAEEKLRDEFALYLFDQGLDPLSELRVGGGLRADVVDLAARPAFFVEAKRYDGKSSPEAMIRGALRQVLDTASSLYADVRPEEVFIVAFRTGGSRFVLPAEALELEGMSIYLRLIDIAPSSETGSRNRIKPRVYTLDDIRDLALQTEAPKPPALINETDSA